MPEVSDPSAPSRLPNPSRPATRDERLKAALKANIARRKAQARGLAAGADETGADETVADEAGADEAGADEAGADEAGADEAGADEAGADEAGQGDG